MTGCAVVGIYNTRQARALDRTSESLLLEAVVGALDDAGLRIEDVDGVSAPLQDHLLYDLACGPAWVGAKMGIAGVMEAAGAIATGQCTTVVLASAQAGQYVERDSTAPWTRPESEFVAAWGLFTAAEFALVARRHMHRFGTTSRQMAEVAAIIRNNGHVNPAAVYYGRGPYTADDVLSSRIIADPYHLLDCATTSEGGCGIVVTSLARARSLRQRPVVVLAGGADHFGPSYRYPPSFDLRGRRPEELAANGWVGAIAGRRAFGVAGLRPQDVDVCELYDSFSFELIRQLEALGFCPPGEGGPWVSAARLGPGDELPITTDGGTMSYSHPGGVPNLMQRITRAVEQLRGTCSTNQVAGAEVALCTNGGSGAMFLDVMLLGVDR
jgi:acetyl-CoA acetyltransferase